MINNTIKQIPYNHEAEQAVLGAMIMESQCIDFVIEQLSTEDFYVKKHQDIFHTINEMFMNNKKIDMVTLSETLNQLFKYKKIDYKQYIMEFVEITPTAANVKEYIKILKNKSALRKIIELSQNMLQSATSENETPNNIMEYAEQKIYSMINNKINNEATHIQKIILEFYDNLRSLVETDEKLSGVKSGFNKIDETISGLNNSDLILIASRPGMGKTSFALNIALNAAKNFEDGSIVIFQLEMSKEQLITKLLSSEALIDSRKLKIGELNHDEWLNLANSTKKLSDLKIYIDDNPLITVTEMKARCRRIKNLKLVVIDYLQLMQTNKKTNNRTQEIADISRSLKIMAKEFNIPIICLSQLSRALEQRSEKNKKPILSDLRESGAIEQDADIVMFIYRSDYYNVNNDNIAEIIIAKNRHGPTDTIKLQWIPEYTKFSDKETL